MENYENIDIKRILEIVFSKKIFIILILVLSIVLGYAYSYYYKKPEYNSSVKILLAADENKEDKEVTQVDLTINSSLISTYSSIAKSTNVISKTIENLGLSISTTELQKNIEVTQIGTTQFLKISVKNNNPEMAKNIANELSQVFSSQIKQIYNLENIKIVDEAEVESQPCNINHTKDLLIFACIGIFISTVLVIAIYFLDDTIKDEKDIERNIGLKNIGTLPINKENDELIIETNPKSYIVECIKTIRTNILYATNKKAILLTSSKQNEGKSWIINNLAIAFAQANKKVILIDTDLRKQSNKNEIFDIEKKEGLSDFIKEISEDKIENLRKSQRYIQETKIPNLHIIQNGTIPPNPAELISSNNMRKLLDLLKNMYDVILLDGTSCMLVSDSIALSSMVDSTILVSESKKTKISDLKKTKKLIEDVNGHILGVITNKTEIQGKKYYGKSYGYYSAEETDELEKIEEKQTSLSLEEIMKIAEEKIQQELLNSQEDNYIIEEDNSLQTDNRQIDYEIKNVRNDINHLKEVQDTNNRKLIEKIQKMNYNEKLEEISKKIESNNYEERFEEISKKIESNNYEEKFEEINNKLINDRKEYSEKLEKIKEKDQENLTIMMQKFMDEINNSNNQIQNLKQMQVNNNSELLEKIENMDYDERLEEISKKIESNNYDKRFEEISKKIESNNYDKRFEEISKKIESNNYDERFEEISKKIENMNHKEKFDEISEKIQNMNYEDRFNEINNKLINEKEEYSQKLEEIKEKDQENLAKMMRKFMNEVNDSKKQIQNLKEMQVNNNLELYGKIENMNYDDRFEEISKKIENMNHEEKFEEINNKLVNDRKEYSQKLEEIKERDQENLAMLIQKFMNEVNNLNNEIKNLKELQQNSNSELLEKIEKMNYEERLEQINEKIQKSNVKNTNNIISFESLKEKRKKAPKKSFQIDDTINYEDLEKLSTCVVDLNEEISAIIAMSN